MYSQNLHLIFTIALFFLVWRMLNEIAYFLTVIYVITILILNIVAPGFFINLQKLKREITGPWDIAKVEPQDEEEMNTIMNNIMRQQQNQYNNQLNPMAGNVNNGLIRSNIKNLGHRRSLSMQSLSELAKRR